MGPGQALTNGESQASDSASKPGFPPNSGAHYRWLGCLGGLQLPVWLAWCLAHSRCSISALAAASADDSDDVMTITAPAVVLGKCAASVVKVGFPGGSVVKNLPANAGDMGSIHNLGRSHILWNI